MTSFETAKLQLGAFRRVVLLVVRAFVVLALAAGAGVGLLLLALSRDGVDAADVVVAVVLLAAPAVVLVFAAGIRQLVGLPERVLRMPQRGAEHVEEVARLAADAHNARLRRAPLLAWRLRNLVGATRDLVGIAVPLRIFAPPFLWLTFFAVVGCLFLVGVGLISLLVLAVS
jgi:hypothetical protein